MKRLGILCAMLLSATLLADKIYLTDGTVIVGQLQKIAASKASIQTSFAGELVIDQANITQIETTAPLTGVLTNEQRFQGNLQPGAASGQLQVAGSSAPIALDSVKALWAEGIADPTIPPPPPGREWSGEAYLDMSGKTGNTEKFYGGAGAKAVMTGPDDRLLMYIKGAYARENSVTNEKEYIAGADYEHSIANTLNSWFVRAEMEKDEFSGIDLRTHVVAGYGYFFFKEEDTQLRFRIGLSYQRREFETGRNEDTYGLDLNLHYERRIDDWGTLVSDLTYTPGLDDIDDYRIYHETALDIPLLMQKPLSLRLGISNEYNNLVAEDVERLDTTYFAKLVYKWK